MQSVTRQALTRDEPTKWKVWESYAWEGPRCLNPAVRIEAGDLIVIDGFACPNAGCPGFGSGDGQVHMWPMSSFKLRDEPIELECVLVRDLTDAFIHPIASGRPLGTAKRER